MKLRTWQAECANLAIKHFKRHRHFLCQATPGAGKSTLAAEVAYRLLAEGAIDCVLCFAPSLEIAQNLRVTFSKRLSRRFDGLMGAIGGAYTYQSMRFLSDEFWRLLDHYRVLVVFDEVHHCAGNSPESANAWGEPLLLKIRDRARYTLSLSGTPWRSDRNVIALSHYDDSHVIQCHYTYELQRAIHHGVCRRPHIVLIDNDQLTLKAEGQEGRRFASIRSLLGATEMTYQQILEDSKALRHILSRANDKLCALRAFRTNAGGLVVASSILHAQTIQRIIEQEIGQPALLVTHKTDDAQKQIQAFRTSDLPWLVSVGMISEGTDIPRLQVCCHLSQVKTELYFRQVLGRILRVSGAAPEDAWLYTFAERQLSLYANRVDLDLPDYPVVIKEALPDSFVLPTPTLNACGSSECSPVEGASLIDWEAVGYDDAISSESIGLEDSPASMLYITGTFKEQVLALFDSPF